MADAPLLERRRLAFAIYPSTVLSTIGRTPGCVETYVAVLCSLLPGSEAMFSPEAFARIQLIDFFRECVLKFSPDDSGESKEA